MIDFKYSSRSLSLIKIIPKICFSSNVGLCGREKKPSKGMKRK